MRTLERPAVNHWRHLAATVLSGGLWGVSWLVASVRARGADWSCRTCRVRAQTRRTHDALPAPRRAPMLLHREKQSASAVDTYLRTVAMDPTIRSDRHSMVVGDFTALEYTPFDFDANWHRPTPREKRAVVGSRTSAIGNS